MVLIMKIKKLLSYALAFTVAMASLGLAACADKAGESTTPEPEEVCEHKLSFAVRTLPSCLADGNIGHYACSECGKLFFDKNGEIELSAENVRKEKVPHTLEHHAATKKVGEFWRCIACYKYFTDANAATETTYDVLFADYYNPIRLTDLPNGGGNFFDGNAEFSPLYNDFTCRFFVTWTNADGAKISDFPATGRVQFNVNFNRINVGNPGGPDWYSFGLAYNKTAGLTYKPFVSGDNVSVPNKFSQLFVKQNGIYVVAIREGASVAFYFEDENGERVPINSNSQFGADQAVQRLAANVADASAEGWYPSITEAAICIGVADPNCIFDKAYAE